jgi:hypothetical protein
MADKEKVRPDIKRAYGRYSASDQGDRNRRDEQRDHGVYGHSPEDAPGQEREVTSGKPGAARRPRTEPRTSRHNGAIKR